MSVPRCGWAGLDEVVPAAQAEAERSRQRPVSLLQRLQKRYPVVSIVRAAKVSRWLSGRRGQSAPEGRPVKTYEYDDRYFRKQHCAVSQTAIKLIVLHSTEGPTAEGGAITLSSSSDVSAHLCVGEGVTYRIVPEWLGSCTVQEPNDWTLNIEQVGFAAWSRKKWLQHLNTIKRAAFWTALVVQEVRAAG